MYTPSDQAERARFAANSLRAIVPLGGSWKSRAVRRVRARHTRLLVELAVPRAIAVTEDYLLLRATAKLHPVLLEPVTPPPADATTKKLRDARKYFEVLVKLWKDDLSVDLTTLASWPTFEELRELRHIFVHRLGMWQPGLDSPKPKLAVRIRLVATNPDAYRGKVPSSPADLAQAIVSAIDVISDADVLVS